MVRELREGDQPLPVRNGGVDITDLVKADLDERRRLGIEEYGTPLQPFNGRSALLDLYQELLDAAQYVKQQLLEDESARRDALAFFGTTTTAWVAP